MSAITLNGTTFYVSDAPLEYSKVGVTLVAANGTRRFAHRTTGGTPINKGHWPLRWVAVSSAVRTAVATIYALTTTFPYVDEGGVSYTVQCEADGFRSSVNFIAKSGAIYYDLELDIFQV